MKAAIAAFPPDAESPQPHVLLDGSLLHDAASTYRRYWGGAAGIPLLGADEGLRTGPLLFQTTRDQLASFAVDALIDAQSELMLGSILWSSLPTQALSHHLSRLLDVTLDDGSEVVMRLADPRVLPFWINVVQGSYRAYVQRAVMSWMYWDQDHAVRAWNTSAADMPAIGVEAPTFPMALTVEQERALLDACFVHLVIGRLRLENAAALANFPPASRYLLVREQIGRAMRYGLETVGDLQAYCGIALETSLTFDEDPVMKAALERFSRQQGLAPILGSLTPADWRRLASARR